jgi:tRNA(fMet)-specific endonuclease VapC
MEYLLDTNAACALWDSLHPFHGEARKFWDNLKAEDGIYISRITVAEIEYGLKVALATDVKRRAEVQRKMASFAVREIGQHTTGPYSDIRSALFLKYGERDGRGRVKQKRPEQLVDRTAARALGTQENDIWIAAIAVEYNLTLVTDDRMAHIKEVCADRLQIVALKLSI